MKIRMVIKGIRVDGDQLRVEASEHDQDAAGWRPAQLATFLVDDVARTREALRVGRELDIEVTPRRSGPR